MSEKLKAFLALITGNIIKDVGEAFDRNFTTKEEKIKALAELEQAYNEKLKLLTALETGSWLRENVRPLVFLIGFIAVVVMMFVPVEVDPGIKKAFMGYMGLMMTTYFVRREILKSKGREK